MTENKFYDEQYYRSHYNHVLDPNCYRLLSNFWAYAIFTRHGIISPGAVLDYGCGPGQVTAALPDVTLFDHSSVCREMLRRRGLKPIERREDISPRRFDVILSSHSLEHSPTPRADLVAFHDWLKPGGRLVLVLPVELDWKPRLTPDSNQHFHAWTFQTITNLLIHCGWKPVRQANLYGPFLLNTLGKFLRTRHAVAIAYRLGKLKHGFRSMLTIAECADGVDEGKQSQDGG